MRRHSLIGVTVFALLATACSADDAGTTSSTAVTSSTSTTTTTSVVAPTTAPPSTTTTTEVQAVTLQASAIFVTTVGMGPIEVGMSVQEAEEAAGFALEGELDPAVSETCYQVTPPAGQAGYEGVSFMVVDERIVRVEVRGDSTTTTRSGAAIGITEDELNAMFPGQIEPAAGLGDGGTAFQFVPHDEAESEYRVIFVFDGGVITEYWAGILPAVAFSEGCL